jgi:hypothetical protein
MFAARYALSLFALGIALLPWTAPAAGADIAVNDTRYRDIRIGTPAETLFRGRVLVPDKDSKANAAGEDGCYYAFPADGKTSPAFMIDQRHLVRIDIDQKDAVTPAGIRVGDSLTRLRQSLTANAPYRLAHEPLATDDAQNFTYITVSRADGRHGIAYVMSEGKVVSILIGETTALHWYEGCI